MIKKLRNVVYGIELSKRQLEKVAEQLRLLSWALSVILTSTNGFHLESIFYGFVYGSCVMVVFTIYSNNNG